MNIHTDKIYTNSKVNQLLGLIFHPQYVKYLIKKI